jgi:molecular chaperone GrpE
MNDPQENMHEESNTPEEANAATPGEVSSEAREPTADVNQRLADAEKQVEFYKDQLLRKVADFENYKRRAEAESASVFKYAKADLLQELLPVVDDFERSIRLARDRRESESFAKGVELIYQKLTKFLQAQGVTEIESLGKEFDVHYHDALLQIPRADLPPHVVIEVVDKGYLLNDRVLRHAKVVVSADPAGQEPPLETNSGSPGRSDASTNTQH